MKANEIPNKLTLLEECMRYEKERAALVMLEECNRYKKERDELLHEINKSLKHLSSRKSIKRSEIYEIKKVTLMEDSHDEEVIKLCEGEIKGIDSGITQLKKVKALLKSYGL